MAFVKLTKAEKNDMFRKGGYRERSIMRNSKCAPTTMVKNFLKNNQPFKTII